MICINCFKGGLSGITEHFNAQFAHDLDIASFSFTKLREMPSVSLNKNEWFNLFDDNISSQTIIQFFKKYPLAIPSSSSNLNQPCYKELARFLGFTDELSDYQSLRARQLRFFAQFMMQECHLTLCPCAFTQLKINRGLKEQHKLQNKLNHILAVRREHDKNLVSLKVKVDYVHSKLDYNFILSAEFLVARNKIETRTFNTSDKLLKRAKVIHALSYDLQDMDTEEKITDFKAQVYHELQKFRDSEFVTDIKVYTSEYFPESQRNNFRRDYKQKDKYPIDIVIADRFIARTCLSSLQKRNPGGKVTDMMCNDILIINDLYKIPNKLKPFPIKWATVERGERESTGKQRIHVKITYNNGQQCYLRNFSNTPCVEQPTLLLPSEEKISRVYHKFTHTHIIFYVWSGIIETAHTREVIYKFGVCRFDWSDTEKYNIEELTQSVMSRQLEYCRSHQIVVNEAKVELISTPMPFNDGWANSALGRLENGLKDPNNNPLLMRNDNVPENSMLSSNPTEIMCNDWHRRLFVIPFIKNYVNTMEHAQSIGFIELENAIGEEYPVPKQQHELITS